MNDVIESCKYHQHDDDRETDAKPNLLRSFRERTASHCFDRIEQKMTAIEQRDREQIQQPDRYREHADEMDQGDEADLRHLTRNLRDPGRAAELVGLFAP
jgi:hypothetical protein